MSLDIICTTKFTVFLKLRCMLLENCSLLGTDVCEQVSEHISMPNGGWRITNIPVTHNKILKAECTISGCVGKFWSKGRL